jgi:hypothetical protein
MFIIISLYKIINILFSLALLFFIIASTLSSAVENTTAKSIISPVNHIKQHPYSGEKKHILKSHQ